MDSIKELILSFGNLKVIENEIRTSANLITESFFKGGKLLLCGNGGSSADCEHIAGEMVKQFTKERPLNPELVEKLGPELSNELHGGLPALSLPSMVGFHTAFNNDNNPEFAFAQQVVAFGKPNDVLWAISTSGNSKNVIQASRTAKALGLKTIGLTGEKGGQLGEVADITLKAPANNVAKIQELHLPIYHAICAFVEDKLFP
ncbi:MAG: SIS domain-containing protein [Verrucomicrobiota bacterium]|nr:SIS domain-containing protein [Verrucomicrobiota bacterium]